MSYHTNTDHQETLITHANAYLTPSAFYLRARTFFAAHGILISAALTDNGSCYCSKVFNPTLGENVRHRFTRPYRPQTNGKAERFNRTLAAEWAYANTYLSDDARAATYAGWLHHDNHHRPHSGIGGKTPIERLDVHNVPENYN